MNIMETTNYAAIVLAAGKGTRMRSARPKVLHTLLGEPMLYYALAALRPLFCNSIWIVAGHEASRLEAAFPEDRFIIQSPQLGTGHAAGVALENSEIASREYLLIINGDAPLITTQLIRDFLLRAKNCDLAFATVSLDDPGEYGRVIRKDGEPVAIVEARDFNSGEHPFFDGEVNAGLYFIRTGAARSLLRLLGNDNKSGEYYLTDIVSLAFEKGLKVAAVRCGKDEALLGVNTPAELARAEDILAQREAARLLENGVVLHAPALVRCGPRVEVESGVEITGPCELAGASKIAAGAIIESSCVIRNSEIGADSRIFPFSHLEGAVVGAACHVGPFARLRPGAVMEKDSHAGNFVELKKTVLGEGAKANHLSYLGDAVIGSHSNIGAGTITCNYDGSEKHATSIGESAFIGSNTALVAPVEVGDGALVGAGSVITENVPAGELAIARARQVNKPKK